MGPTPECKDTPDFFGRNWEMSGLFHNRRHHLDEGYKYNERCERCVEEGVAVLCPFFLGVAGGFEGISKSVENLEESKVLSMFVKGK